MKLPTFLKTSAVALAAMSFMATTAMAGDCSWMQATPTVSASYNDPAINGVTEDGYNLVLTATMLIEQPDIEQGDDGAIMAMNDMRPADGEGFNLGDMLFVTAVTSQPGQFLIEDTLAALNPTLPLMTDVVEGTQAA